MMLAGLWFIGGLFLDGWAHNHVPELESFFTPWHAVFYSGFFAVAIALFIMIALNRKHTSDWQSAIPIGYGPVVAGATVFFLGGVGDMAWHEIFGIEADIEALLSPTHLILASGMTLMLSGPLMSWWNKKDVGNWLSQVPMMLSATFIAGLIIFMTQFAHVVDRDMGGSAPESSQLVFYTQAMIIMGNLFHASVLTGIALLLLRRGRRLPFLTFTILLTVTMYAMAMMREGLILVPAAFGAGLMIDIFYHFVSPIEKNRWALRVLAFALPALLYKFTTLTTILEQGTWWSLHMWTGMPVMAGIAGLLLSFVAWPPQEKA